MVRLPQPEVALSLTTTAQLQLRKDQRKETTNDDPPFTLSLLLGIALWQQQPSVAAKVLSPTASITVNTTADTADATCADASGNCSLRAAKCSWSDFTSFKPVGLSEGRQRSVKDV